MAGGVGPRADVGGVERRGRGGRHLVRAGDAPVPVGRAAHRPPEGLLGGRRDRSLPAPQRAYVLHPMGYDAFGLPAENHAIRTGQHPRASTDASIAEFRRQFKSWGMSMDWSREFGTHEPTLLPVDPVAVPAPVRARARLPQGGGGQVVPQGRHRARQRAGGGRALRALRHPGRGAPAGAVVLPHHRLCGPAARRPEDDRVAPARGHDAGELDRPVGGGRGGVPLRGARHRLPGVHHAAGHALRRHVLRPRSRASRRAAPQRVARGPRLREPRAHRVGRGARGGGEGEDRRAAWPHRDEPGQRRGDPDVRRRLRADGVRDRRDHGRARARPARLRLRPPVRAADKAGRGAGGGVAARRTRPSSSTPGTSGS